MCRDCEYFRNKGESRCFICGEWFDKDIQLRDDVNLAGYKEKYPYGYVDESGTFMKNDW